MDPLYAGSSGLDEALPVAGAIGLIGGALSAVLLTVDGPASNFSP